MKRGRGILVLLAALAGVLIAAAVAPASSPTAGQLDASYGSGGAVLDDFYGTQDPDQANAIAIQPDGKIVAAGSSGTGGTSPVVMVARYNSDGSRDSTFGPPPHGFKLQQVCFNSTCGSAEADAVKVMGNGDIVVAGVAVNNQCLFVMRLTPSGALDSSFAGASGNSNGIDAFQLGSVTSATYHVGGVAVQSDGKIVVDGTFGAGIQGFIARIPSAGGALDTAGWNNPSGYNTDASSFTSYSALALQPSDGKAVAVGTDVTGIGSMRIVRFTTAGAHDTTFNAPSGFSDNQISSAAEHGAGLVATSDGRLIVAATDDSGSNAGIGLFQFKQLDGTLDTTFAGGAGKERVPLPGGAAGKVTALALDSTGRLLVAGQDTTNHHTFVARLSAGGTLDSSFGSGGFSIPTTIGSSDGAQGVAPDASDNPVVAGFGTPQGASDTDAMTARFLGATPPPIGTTTGTTTTPTTGTTGTTTPTPPLIPILSKVSQTHPKWKEGTRLPTLARTPKVPVGTTFSFELNVQSRVSFAFTQQLPGRKVNGRCVAQTKKNRSNHACVRTVTPGSLQFTGHSGVNKVFFQGRLSRQRKLEPGRYTLIIAATNGAGRRSASKQLTFTIVR